MRHLVGISGFKRSGKNTFADVLRQVAHERGLAFVAVAFADPLRRAAAAAYGVDVSNFTDDAKKDTVCEAWGITYRQMLINLGEAMRGIDANHWVKALQQWVVSRQLGANWLCQPLLITVTDVRRVNEAAAVHDLGGVNVLVRRPGVVWDGHVNEELMHWAGEYQPELIGFHGCQYDADERLCYGEVSAVPERLRTRPVFDYVLNNDAATVQEAMIAMQWHAEAVVSMLIKQSS